MSEPSGMDHLLRRWLNGRINRREEQELEAAARQDPFLAEALEGYRAFADSNHQKAVAQVQRRIRQRSNRFPMQQFIQLAAALLVLVAGAWMVWYFSQPRQEGVVSMAEEQPAARQEEPAASLKAEQVPASGNRTENAPKAPGAPSVAAREKRPAEAAQDAAPAEFSSRQPSDIPEAVSTAPQSFSEPESAPSLAQAAPVKAFPLSGIVTSETGQPLPNITVVSEDSRYATRTDDRGRFTTLSFQSNPALRMSRDGNTFQQVAPSAANPDRYVLSAPVSAAPEARSLLPQTAKSIAPLQGAAIPQPVGGMNALRQHILQNLRYPELALQYRIEGKVVLSFLLSPRGIPGDFEILESPGYGLDLEAVRLLQSGPNWTGSGSGQRFVYTLEFKLPN